jgi:hypothetical protein
MRSTTSPDDGLDVLGLSLAAGLKVLLTRKRYREHDTTNTQQANKSNRGNTPNTNEEGFRGGSPLTQVWQDAASGLPIAAALVYHQAKPAIEASLAELAASLSKVSNAKHIAHTAHKPKMPHLVLGFHLKGVASSQAPMTLEAPLVDMCQACDAVGLSNQMAQYLQGTVASLAKTVKSLKSAELKAVAAALSSTVLHVALADSDTHSVQLRDGALHLGWSVQSAERGLNDVGSESQLTAGLVVDEPAPAQPAAKAEEPAKAESKAAPKGRGKVPTLLVGGCDVFCSCTMSL